MFKRILVTGASGVAAKGLALIVKEFSNEFIFVGTKECDLTDPASTKAFIHKINPDAIIHFAAKSGGIGLSMAYPATLLRDNLLMNVNVLEAARSEKVKKVVMTLSAGMYPPEAPLPLKEESIHAGAAHFTNYSYAYAKRIVEPLIRAYRKEYNMNVIGLVPNGIFGPFDNFNFETAPMLPSLIRRFYESKDEMTPLVVWGDGSPLREYTFSLDLARAYMWCLNHYDHEDILNVGSTEEHTIKDIAFMISDALGISKNRIAFDTSKPNGIFRKNTDNNKFVQLSDFKYRPLRDGLKDTVDWFGHAMQSDSSMIRTANKVK